MGVFLLVVLSLVCFAYGQSVTIVGQGSTVFKDVSDLYTIAQPSVAVSYTENTLAQYTLSEGLGRVDILYTQSALPPASHTQSACGGVYDLHEFPINIDGLVFIYSINGVDTVSPSTPKLRLDRDTIVGIYNGTINSWNDPKIVALNPGLASQLPTGAAAAFTPVYIADSSLSVVFSQALSSFSADWSAAQTAAGTAWPFPAVGKAMDNTNGAGQKNVQTFVTSNSAIGFMQNSFATGVGSVGIALVKNKAGTFVNPTTLGSTADTKLTSLSAAVSTGVLNRLEGFLNLSNSDPAVNVALNMLSIVDGADTNAYPFAHFNMITTRTNSFTDCNKAKMIYGLLTFALSDPQVTGNYPKAGKANLPSGLTTELLSVLSKMTCCQLVAGDTTSKQAINGLGTEISSPSLKKLSDLYASLYSAQINFAVDTAATANAAVNAGTKDFSLTVAGSPSGTGVTSIPMFGSAAVVVYNLAERSPVSMSMATLSSIFQGTITTWNQVDSSLPARTINKIGSADPDVATIFYKATSTSNIFTVGTNSATLSAINTTADSIGLLYFSDFSSLSVQTASLINAAGNAVQPNATTIQAATAAVTTLSGSPTSSSVAGAWPMTAFTYVNFKVSTSSCIVYTDLAQFIYWAFTDAAAGSSATSAFAYVPTGLSALVASTLKGINCGSTPLLTPRILVPGAGSTFAAGVYQSWISAYSFVDNTLDISYAGVGSGAGVTDITKGTVVWAGSDADLTAAQASAGVDLGMFPAFAGSVVMAYRLDTLGANSPQLNLTREVIVDIYLGNIKMWNDPAIVSLNPEVKSLLPNAQIVLVYRSDSSGTTNIFSSALKAFGADKWTAGVGTTVKWPVQNGTLTGMGSSGLGLRIFSTANSLGYLELSYAAANGLSYAILRNKAGNWVTPSLASVQSAMNDYKNSFLPDFTCSIVDGPGANSWPLAAYTYLVLHTKSMTDINQAKGLLEFIKWGMTSNVASQRASALGFTSLTSDFVETQFLPRLSQITVNGVSVLGIAPTKKEDKANLGVALGVSLGLGIPLLLLIGAVAWYMYRGKRKPGATDYLNVEASEWDDNGGKAVELQAYNDTMGVQLGNGQDLLRFGVAKGARFPVNIILSERIPITNNSTSNKNFAFAIPRDENRFKLSVVPGHGILKAGETLNVEVKFTLLMTTTINRKLKFEVAGAGEQVIPLNISGDVSTRLDPNEIDIIGKPIGQGAFGTVYRGQYRGTQVAVKVLARQNELLKAQTDEFLKEIDLMHKLRSPFIVNFIGASYVPGKLCVVTEFVEKGSVANILQKIKLEHVLRLKIAYDCCQAMAFLHNNGVMHRDLKPANLLVVSLSSSAEATVKLADFGTSRTVNQIYAAGRNTNGWGTPGYMAPELLARGEYSGKVDVYAFGILLLELYIQKDPFSFLKKVWDLPEVVLRGNRPEIPAECPGEYATLITQCWAHLPENRPTFNTLLEDLEPMYKEERARVKDLKARRLAESGGTHSPKFTLIEGSGNSGGPDSLSSGMHSSDAHATNLSNLPTNLSNLPTYTSSNAASNTHSNISNANLSNVPGQSGLPPHMQSSGPHTAYKGKEKATTLSNLSNDNQL